MIIRRRHTANFTTIGNVLFNDERLEADELGVLAYLLSRPDDWEVRRSALARRFRVGRDSIRRIMRNAIRYGWIIARTVRLSNGTVQILYEVRDEPGPELTEEKAVSALSLVSSDAGPGESSAETELRNMEGVEIVPPDTPDRGAADRIRQTAPGRLLNTDSPRTESNQIEREAPVGHDRKARFIAAFEMRWPTAATDDRSRTAKAARDLADDEEAGALAGIGPFLEQLKRAGRKHPPAGWKYLEEKRWTLLETPKTEAPAGSLRHNSVEAKAVVTLYEIAGRGDFLRKVMRTTDGSIWYRKSVTPQLAALAQANPSANWLTLTRQQAGAWNSFLDEFVTVQTRSRLAEGSRAPWPWPPSKDGTLYAGTGPPDALLTDADEAELDKLKAV